MVWGWNTSFCALLVLLQTHYGLRVFCAFGNLYWPFFKVEMKLEAIPQTLEPSFRVTEVWRRMKQTAGLGSWGAAEAWVGFPTVEPSAATQHNYLSLWPGTKLQSTAPDLSQRNPHQLFSQRRLWIDTTTVKRMSGLESRTFLSACQREKFVILTR